MLQRPTGAPKVPAAMARDGSTTPCTGYDLTTSVEKSTPDHNIMGRNLKQVFKNFAFQKERGEDGYVHWQIRGRLYKKRRLDKAMIKEFQPLVFGGHWSITSKGVHTDKNFNYQMKADTRVEGPWTDEDFEDPPVLTRQLKKFYKHVEETGKYPWQAQIEALCDREDDRFITCIVDEEGNAGKSVFIEHLEYVGKAYEVPPVTCMEDLMQLCMCLKAQKCYCIDMPKAMKKDKLAGFYSGLEALKNGVMYDKRYAFKKRRIDRPQVFVYTNTCPDLTLLSQDRWDIWYMYQKQLIRATEYTLLTCKPPGL